MKPTIEGSQNFDIVFMSVGKEEKGFKVEAAGEKSTVFNDGLIITVEDGELMENDTLKTAKGIIKFPPKTYKNLKNTRDDRKVSRTRRNNKGMEI